MNLSDLIERAAERAGSHAELARTLEVTRQRLNDWKHGARSCPPQTQARIAELAGEDAKEWLWRAVMGKVVASLATLGVAATLFCGLAGYAPRAEAHGERGNV